MYHLILVLLLVILFLYKLLLDLYYFASIFLQWTMYLIVFNFYFENVIIVFICLIHINCCNFTFNFMLTHCKSIIVNWTCNIILLLFIGFTSYSLVIGQMSFWVFTFISNILTCILLIGYETIIYYEVILF